LSAPAAATAAVDPPAPPRRPRRWLTRLLATATGAYALGMLVLLWVMRHLADLWLYPTPLLYVPRVGWLIPLALLALVTLACRRFRLLPAQAAIALVIAGPLMNVNLPVGSLFRRPPPGDRLRVLTLNRAAARADMVRLEALARRERIDVIFFQEPLRNPEWGGPVPPWPETWNHDDLHMVYTRLPLVEAVPTFPPSYNFEIGDTLVILDRVRVRLPSGRVAQAVAAHMPTPRKIFESYMHGGAAAARPFLGWRRRQAALLARTLAEYSGEPIVVGADLNFPADSPLMSYLRRDFRLAFEQAGWGYGYSRTDYFPFIGIDHVLVSPHWAVTSCAVGPPVGSDHLPVIAEIVLPASRR
jgi:endonuclease/exonuclease/phosphatase (EEP) superfamily protein YafD